MTQLRILQFCLNGEVLRGTLTWNDARATLSMYVTGQLRYDVT
jgi:hypothetical protein